MHTLTSATWWQAAGLRALRTALVTVLPFLPAIQTLDRDQGLAAALTVALAIVLSLATSLRSLPEVDDVARPWPLAALDRFARTFGQVLAAGLASAVLITDVDWPKVLLTALAAGIGSVILAIVAKLPEAEPVTVPAGDVVARLDGTGEVVTGDASNFPPGVPIAREMPLSSIAQRRRT